MKIFAVIVTYNRLKLLKQNLDCLYKQSRAIDEIVVVDNSSTDGTFDFCCDFQKNHDNFHLIHLEENTGGAGGFARGIQEAISLKADYIWGMDDDAMPRMDALEKLLDKINLYKSNRYCLTSNTYFFDGNHELQRIQFEKDCRLKHLTFVGFFVSKEVVNIVGLPRKDLFIYYDDLDYSLRMEENNIEIVGINDSIIEHPYIMPKNERKVLNFTINVPQMPKWKMYYWMRNNLLIRKQGNRNYFNALLIELYILIKILIFDSTNFTIAMKGMIHGICGKSGHVKGMP